MRSTRASRSRQCARTVGFVGATAFVFAAARTAEAFLGISFADELTIRLGVSYLKSDWISETSLYPPVARVDGEIGFGLDIALAF